MTGYELLYIIANKYTDDEVSVISGKIDELLKAAGFNLTKTENLGKRKLAYPIQKNNHGHYMLTEFSGEPQKIDQISSQLRMMVEVIRHSIIHRVNTGIDQAKRVRLAQEMDRVPQTVEYKAPQSSPISTAPSSGKKYVPDIDKELGLKDEETKAPATLNEPPPEGDDKKVGVEELDKKLDELLKNL